MSTVMMDSMTVLIGSKLELRGSAFVPFYPPGIIMRGGYSDQPVCPSVRLSVCPSVIIFFSGAELENHSVYFIETWQIYQSHTEVVPFAILEFLKFLFFTFPWQQV